MAIWLNIETRSIRSVDTQIQILACKTSISVVGLMPEIASDGVGSCDRSEGGTACWL